LANDVALGLRMGIHGLGYLNLKVKISSFFLDLFWAVTPKRKEFILYNLPEIIGQSEISKLP
jgi:hypothetical protein